MLIFDAHLDLGMNALEWNRDYTRPLHEIREREREMTDRPDRGKGTVCFPEMRKGQTGICVATLIGRYIKPSNRLRGWHSPEQAWAQTQGQLAWYRAMEEKGELSQITTVAQLDAAVELWTQDPPVSAPISYLLSLEGADSMVTIGHVERAYAQGLRAIGPANFGPGIYAQGTNARGGIGAKGAELLKEMDRLGIILDVSHLCDESFREAMDVFQGKVWASHSNCRKLVQHERQFTSEQLQELITRGAVIGASLDAWMLVPGWILGKTKPAETGVKLEHIVDHIDHVCQLAGNSLHAGIGSDLDGGFGLEESPMDLDSIADVQRLPAILKSRGYSDEDVANVMHRNFVRFLQDALS
ncbi:peptidase M19 [Puniceicoccales bacterium CK1056]|uniref:Peptidase M19 n=1 Tax=Oceanipulchritudo coccoides TaxID=2706888 RepID=A0A6B2LZN0_9BACT|nr:membrane dipeptidase [Oceanipulchritudo coccoides]NDV61602.1 peptidase M19 [Oceanipulchritudo coccoides]